MAERRMFAKSIIDSDAFLEMPATTQMLYFHLSMRADDEGFLNNPKRIMKMVGASEDDMKILIAKKFILVFESGVIVIKHWRIHNYIQKDRFKPTNYSEEREQLTVKPNGAYTMDTTCIQDGYNMDTQVRLGKDRLGKDRLGENNTPTPDEDKKPYGTYKNVMLTDAEYKILKDQFLEADAMINNFSDKLKAKGYKYASHYAAILTWEKQDRADRQKEKGGMMTHGYDYDALFGSTG